MAKQKQTKYYSRKFLNKEKGLAAIEIDFDTWDFGAGFDCAINISDCSKAIHLDFSVYNSKDLQNTARKLEDLVNELLKFQIFIEDNYENIEEAMKKKQEERKKRINQRVTLKELKDATE